MGATFVHVVIINVLAIVIEYFLIKPKYQGRFLLVRVIGANLVSVVVGTIVVYSVPEMIGGAMARSDTYVFNNYDRFALCIGLVGLFLSNVAIETPAYLIGQRIDKNVWKLVKRILVANLITNIPVIFIYLLIMS